MSFLGPNAFLMHPALRWSLLPRIRTQNLLVRSLSSLQALGPPFVSIPLVQRSKDPDSTQLTLLIKS